MASTETKLDASETVLELPNAKDTKEPKVNLEIDELDRVKVPLNRVQFISVFISFTLAVFLVALDGTIVSTAIPKIAHEFNALDQIAWIGSGFLLTSTAFSPLYGELCNIFGRKPTFMMSILLFEAGSLVCGIAGSMLVLIIGRIVAGIGGGGIFSVVLILISDVTSIRESGKYQGILGAVFGLSSVIGPLLGGYFTDSLSWRWCFLINLPVGGIAALTVYFLLNFPPPEGNFREKLDRVDVLGTFFIVSASVCLLMPLQFGGSVWAWKDAKTIALLIVGSILSVVAGYVEFKVAKNPIIPPQLFANRSVAMGLLIAFLLGNCFICSLFYLPTFFQLVHGETATISGLEVTPLIFGLVVTSVLSGYYVGKTAKYKIWFYIGSVILVASLYAVSTLDPNTNKALQVSYLVFLGLGIGCIIQTRVYAVQAGVPPEDIASATSTSNFFLNFGGTIGLAVAGTIFNNCLSDALGPLTGGAATTSSTSLDAGSIAASPYASFIVSAIASSLGKSYYWGIPMAALIFVATFFIVEKKLDQDVVVPVAL
ncbi:hypothetical protein HDV03_003380 [Kappamyces sp. JEL0829]|nr:hypothetical protein HDV03_003380 [Kappamyces sp. JEL0829]